ncbi:MAG TPA: ShlB/FhaC/HecB family hemolysin secretion/activation protein [Burkholderiales bacterium]|nr:ShlB/FhaC/HecB family hemolysin secretion/activation protein [Betaproteobacteria bacterium]HQR52078.1 ShlB/FhaC/HecB family hemolysin secretion/activation protein [Burkholderiales bacterium]
MPSTFRRIRPGALFLALLCSPAPAQVLPPDIGTTIREIEQRRPAVPQTREPALQVDEPARPALQAAPDVRFRVERLRITGATAFPPAELTALLGDFEGGERGLADLEQAAARITRFYREHGYLVARAYVPAQEIAGGEVEIAVLEGCFGGLEVRNTSRLSDALVRDTLSQASSGAVIRQGPLERELLLLSELAGVSSSATLKPGAEVGTSDLLVDVAPVRTFSGAIEADNYGNRYTGALRLGGSVAAANLAGRGDLLSVRGLVTEQTDLWYGRAAYQMPVAGNGLRLGAAFSRTYYTLGQGFSALDANGNANVYSLFGLYPAIRSTRGNLDAQLSFDYLDLDDRYATGLSNPRWIRSVSIGMNGDLRDGILGGGVSAASLAYVNGYLQFRDQGFYQIDQATTQSAGSFDKLVYSALRLQHLGEALQLYLGIQGQFAGKNLDPSQKFVLGGPNGVRAYPQGEGVGDDGFLGTAELRYALPPWGWLTRPQVFAFFDGGTVRINQDPFRAGLNRISQYGAGIGANLLFAGGFSLRGSVAWRVGSEPVPGVSNASSQGWIQLVKFF